jgi:monoamine oxidase
LYRAAAVGGSALLFNTMNAWGMGMNSTAGAPPALTGSGKGKKVVILGAGLAGMTAAYELGKLGYECQVLEARAFAGGRCQTARKGFSLQELGGETQACNFDEGQYINHGPWRIPLHHQSTLHYTRLFEVPLEVMVNDNDHAFVYLENAGPLSKQRLRPAQLKSDMRGHVAELLAKSVQNNQLDRALTADDKTLLLDYLAHEGQLQGADLRYKGRSGRGFTVNPGAGLTPGTASDPLGKALFARNCAACHQATGRGIPGAFPALAGNPLVQGPAAEVATVLLKGRGGMPDFSGSLGDPEIALVLSYVRSSWGNQAAPLQEQEVAALREALHLPKAQGGAHGNKH